MSNAAEIAELRGLIMDALGNGTDEEAWPSGTDFKDAFRKWLQKQRADSDAMLSALSVLVYEHGVCTEGRLCELLGWKRDRTRKVFVAVRDRTALNREPK